jgi:predicted nucleic acid-binding protein
VRIGLDTNVLVYAEGVNGEERRDTIDRLIERIGGSHIVVPVQALAELHYVLVRKARRSRADAGQSISNWLSGYETAETTPETIEEAIALSALHQLQIFDAVILSASMQAGCVMLLSEDMQDGFQWRGCTVVNPFAAELNPLLRNLLSE